MAKVAGIRLLLMRSGTTSWDAAGRVQGACDLPLTGEGRAKVAERIAAIGSKTISTILTAPDEGSRETARVLARARGRWTGRVSVEPDLAELPLGLWEGLRLLELEERYCRAGRLWLEDPSGVTAPEGECIAEYYDRVMATLRACLGKCRPGTTAAVVVRPIALGVIRCTLNGAETSELWTMIQDRPDDEWYDLRPGDPRLWAPSRLLEAAAGSI